MKIQEYIKAMENIEYPSHPDFLNLALGEEIGELKGKFKRSIRGDYQTMNKFRAEVLGEVGDILWCLVKNWTYPLDIEQSVNSMLSQVKIDTEQDVLPIVLGLHEYEDDLDILIDLQRILVIISKGKLGIEDALAISSAKMLDRQERGCFHGQGDYR